MATLVLGDDHVVFLDALSTVLSQSGYGVGGVARSPAEMVALVRREQPDACLIDRNAAMDDGQAIGRLLAASECTSVVVLSANPSSEAVGRALDAGASGYLHQSRGIGALVAGLERVLRGEIVVDVPETAPPLRRPAEPTQALRLAAHLTSRERECLLMLVEGLDTAAMVGRLGVSRTTVRTHLQAVLTKLGVHSRLEAASFAVRHRLPDLWSGDESAQTVMPAARMADLPVSRVAPVRVTSTVRPLRPLQVADLGAAAGPPALAVAAGQGASAG
ncbi:MAG TPA: response regulator transcription factor [Streptosporangiaceae bacterium]|nr:response regulator transcription factor [Streptosporangiaceae bacterium]